MPVFFFVLLEEDLIPESERLQTEQTRELESEELEVNEDCLTRMCKCLVDFQIHFPEFFLSQF